MFIYYDSKKTYTSGALDSNVAIYVMNTRTERIGSDSVSTIIADFYYSVGVPWDTSHYTVPFYILPTLRPKFKKIESIAKKMLIFLKKCAIIFCVKSS